MRRFFPAALVLGWVAVIISVTGDELLHFIYLVSAVAGDHPVSIGTIGFLVGISSLAGGPIGAWLDRNNDRRHQILLASMLASMAATLVLWTGWTSSYAVTLTYAACFILGLFDLVTTTIWQAAVPEIVGDGDSDLTKRAVGWTAMTVGVGATTGPLLAGTLVPTLGQQRVILLDALSFLVAAAFFVPTAARLRARGVIAAVRPRLPRGGSAKPTKYLGVRLVMKAPLVRGPATTLAIMNFVGFATTFAIPLLVAQRRLPVVDIAWASAASVVASVAGSALATYFRQEHMFLSYVTWEPAVRAAGVLVLATCTSTFTLLLGVVLFNLPQGMGRVARLSYLVSSFDANNRASAVGAYKTLVRGLMPVAPLVMQPLVTSFGAATFFSGSAVLLVALTISLLLDGTLRRAADERARQTVEATSAI